MDALSIAQRRAKAAMNALSKSIPEDLMVEWSVSVEAGKPPTLVFKMTMNHTTIGRYATTTTSIPCREVLARDRVVEIMTLLVERTSFNILMLVSGLDEVYAATMDIEGGWPDEREDHQGG